MFLPIIKLPLIIAYLLAIALMFVTKNKEQQKTYFFCALVSGGLLAI